MAVYTQVDEGALRSFLDGFNIGTLAAYTGIADGVENTNYLLETSQGKYILTLFEKRVNPEELPFYISFMSFLKERGLAIADVQLNKQGKHIGVLCGKPAMISSFLEGQWQKEITPPHCRQMGATLGTLHLAGRAFPEKRRNNLSLPAWKNLIHACRNDVESLEKGLFDFLDRELEYLHLKWPKFLPRGTVHADLFPDNVFFTDGTLSGIIDFYFSCSETLTYDLMLTFNPWCFNKDGSLNTPQATAFFEGYLSTRTPTKGELRALPFFGRAAAMRIISTRLYDWLNPAKDALVKPKDPMEHIRILRFHQQVTSLRDYGLSL